MLPKQWDASEFQEAVKAIPTFHMTLVDRPNIQFLPLRDLPMRPTQQDTEERKPDFIRLCEQVDWLVGAIYKLQKDVEAMRPDESGPDNYDMTAEQVRDLILANYKLGVPFYPSDVADDHGLDYDTVVQAMNMLRKEGRMKDEGT